MKTIILLIIAVFMYSCSERGNTNLGRGDTAIKIIHLQSLLASDHYAIADHLLRKDTGDHIKYWYVQLKKDSAEYDTLYWHYMRAYEEGK